MKLRYAYDGSEMKWCNCGRFQALWSAQECLFDGLEQHVFDGVEECHVVYDRPVIHKSP